MATRPREADGRDGEASGPAPPRTRFSGNGSVVGETERVVDEDIFSWSGPRTVILHKGLQGFGFTLRHFIVYPPESTSYQKEEEAERGGDPCQLTAEAGRTRQEPMDTIFVKQVKEGSPASEAGLQTGDRIVQVNGESIIGKSYSQVISLIQNCDLLLRLSVMPKDEDILQLAYSQDAYLKGNDSYKGKAHNIPEPPPMSSYPFPSTSGISQPGSNVASTCGMGPASSSFDMPIPPRSDSLTKSSPVLYAQEKGGMKTFIVPPGKVVDLTSMSHACQPQTADSQQVLRKASLPAVPAAMPVSVTSRSALQEASSRIGEALVRKYMSQPHDANQPYSAGATYAPPGGNYYLPCGGTDQGSNLPRAGANVREGGWDQYPTYKDYRRTFGTRTLQERLDVLRGTSHAAPHYPLPAPPDSATHYRTRSSSQDRGQQGAGSNRCRSASQDRLGENVQTKEWGRSVSQDALAMESPPASFPNCRTHSNDNIARSGKYEFLQQKDSAARNFSGGLMNAMGDAPSQSNVCTATESVRFPTERGTYSSQECRDSSDRAWPRGSERCRGENTGSSGMAPARFEPPVFGKRYDVKSRSGKFKPDYSSTSVKSQPPDSRKTDDARNSVDAYHCRSKSLESRDLLNSGLQVAPPPQLVRAERTVSESDSQSAPTRVRQGCSVLQETKDRTGSYPALHSNLTAGRQQQQQRSPGVIELAATSGVVLREKPPLGRPAPPLRHPSYILAVDAQEAGLHPGWLPTDRRKGFHREVEQEAVNKVSETPASSSLAAIPFIDEPGSPGEQDSEDISASAVVSSQRGPPTVGTSGVVRRQWSNDPEDAVKGSRRSSYLLAMGTERSKSYDEGLDEIREEGKTLLKQPKRVPSIKKLKNFFSEGIVEDPEFTEDAGAGPYRRRRSTSDITHLGLGGDVTKQGWLHFRFHGEKAKRLSGSTRLWKQVYCLLRGHTLLLHKDKREGGGAGEPSVPEDDHPVSIKNSLVDISYSDTRRKNVFRLTTSDCSEYLFQAESRDEMLGWIHAIQEGSNPDGEDSGALSRDLISRKIKEYSNVNALSNKVEPSPRMLRQTLGKSTLLGPKSEQRVPRSPKQDSDRKAGSKEDLSPPKDKALWRKGIQSIMKNPFSGRSNTDAMAMFGVRLEDCPPGLHNKFLPLIVEVCCGLVEERGLESTGIYRVPGNNAAVCSLQEELNRGVTEIDTNDDKWRDLNVISSLLKSFFRKLPEPLFTDEKYYEFIDANRMENGVERLKALKKLIHELPEHHFHTLKFLSMHLKTIAENSPKNKMEPRNLAIVFGPTLVRTSEDNMTDMVTHMPDQYKIVETLIQHYDWFFTDDSENDATTPMQDSTAVEAQPMPNINHLLTNIGRTASSPGDVSDTSATSDSAKSKVSLGSSRDLYSRELIPSILAAAHRKRRKLRGKAAPGSSDEELESGFSRNNNAQLPSARAVKPTHEPETSERQLKKDSGSDVATVAITAVYNPHANRCAELPRAAGLSDAALALGHREPLSRASGLTCKSTSSPTLGGSFSSHAGPNHGMSSQAFLSSQPRQPKAHKDFVVGPCLADERPGGGDGGPLSYPRHRYPKTAAAVPRFSDLKLYENTTITDANSVTSDYSTTSSSNFPCWEAAAATEDARSLSESRDEEADDEQSELVSEVGGTHDSDDERLVSGSGRGSRLDGSPVSSRESMAGTDRGIGGGSSRQKTFNSYRLIECDTLARKHSGRKRAGPAKKQDVAQNPFKISEQDCDAKSAAEQSSSSLTSVRSASSETLPVAGHSEPALHWRPQITDRLKSRLKISADDMFGTRKKPAESKKADIKRRHTLGGHRDLEGWREGGESHAGGRPKSPPPLLQPRKEKNLSAVDRLKPKCRSQDFCISGWIERERLRGSSTDLDGGAVGILVERPEEAATSSALPLRRAGVLSEEAPFAPGPPGSHGDDNANVYKAEPRPGDPRPHKLTQQQQQVLTSRFYQYL
ncbi:LOW QUALITY PROTEIN: rho GTPase-activating protein 21 [Lethenteron reissneri]|uniref:LOW QUALITY PROTEIN: rho GTPase-activating protein 21 n=1 Tax=Lethenteron reissneri TaxID=7753 RepID=UPI002AB61EA5|nr:LOW QUALITY PROTEIN: rho GTPase-activating protein 21 [Lethenteron reissneri]